MIKKRFDKIFIITFVILALIIFVLCGIDIYLFGSGTFNADSALYEEYYQKYYGSMCYLDDTLWESTDGRISLDFSTDVTEINIKESYECYAVAKIDETEYLSKIDFGKKTISIRESNTPNTAFLYGYIDFYDETVQIDIKSSEYKTLYLQLQRK